MVNKPKVDAFYKADLLTLHADLELIAAGQGVWCCL